MRTLFLIFVMGLMLSGCGKYYLSVQQQWIDANYLASVQINTPDPRKANPPLGQMLIIDWLIPSHLMKQKPHVEIDVIYWDYTKETICLPIKRRMDYITYELLNEMYEKKGGILTYKIKIVTPDGNVFKEAKHQLFAELITIEDEPPFQREAEGLKSNE